VLFAAKAEHQFIAHHLLNPAIGLRNGDRLLLALHGAVERLRLAASQQSEAEHGCHNPRPAARSENFKRQH